MKTGKLVVYAVLFLFLLLGLVRFMGGLSGTVFNLELLGLLILLFLLLAGFMGYSAGWGERLFFIASLFYLGNVVLVWYFRQRLDMVLLVLAVAGFLLSLPKRQATSVKKKQKQAELHSEVFDAPTAVPEEVSESKEKVTFTPGKYVASKMSNTYHEPKCEWAKKIVKPRRVWFASKEEAWEKEYKAHSCVTE